MACDGSDDGRDDRAPVPVKILIAGERFWFMWDDLSHGTLGAVVLADVRRLADPFVVALNSFPGTPRHGVDAVRKALDLDPHVPIVTCDARERGSCRDTLVTLVDHAIALVDTGVRTPSPSGSPV
jgi:uncharacterized protein